MRRTITMRVLLFALVYAPACDSEPDYEGPSLCLEGMDAATCYEAVLACNAYESAHDECHYRLSYPGDQHEGTTSPFNRCMFFMAENPEYLPWTWCWSLETTCEERMDAIENGTSNDPVCGHLRPREGEVT